MNTLIYWVAMTCNKLTVDMLDTVVISLLTSLCVTLIAIPLIRQYAIRLHLTDNPTGDALKIHKNPIPFVGGIGMLAGLTSGLLIANPQHTGPLVLVICISLAFGLLDDLFLHHRSSTSLAAKILSQLFLGGICVFLLNRANLLPENIPTLAIGFAFLFVVNATNLNDGLDGLLSGIALISGIGFLFAFSHLGMRDGALLSAMLIGITAGFLAFNLPPASIFMGDNGSYLLGALFSILGILLINTQGSSAILGTLCIIGMPILNACFVSVRRIAAGQSPLVGDRLHLYDMIGQRTGNLHATLFINYCIHGILVITGVSLLT
ncbi:MAG: MraY family glycosyltransferase [bacterium]|nr:MraY family glycosyltransferase [bacterium]